MKPAVTYPDAEHLVADFMVAALADVGEDATVKVGIPADWTPTSGDHLRIVSDGTPGGTWPISAKTSVRMVAWSASPSGAKRLAALAQGLLLAHPGGDGIVSARFLSGVLATRDDQTHADIAMTTSQVTLRSVPIEPSGS